MTGLLGIRNELTIFLDEYVSDDCKCEGYYVYIFEHNGVPDTFETDTEYGWFIRYPGYTCANVVFDKATKTVKDFTITERDGGLGTIFKIPSPELTTLVLNKFKGKPLSL